MAVLLAAASVRGQTPSTPPGAAGTARRAPGEAGDRRPAPAVTRATSPQADSPARREVAWDPRWPRFRTSEYVATSLFAATAFATLAIPPSPGRWSTVNAFDRAARDALRIRSDRYREVARDASDLLLTLMTNHLAADAVLVTWWWHGRGSVAWELAMMDIEALALNAALNGLVAGLTSRERPYRDGCTGPEPLQDKDCRESKRYRSFFSGHSSTAFTAAGLVCTHHAHLPLYGGGARDALACAASLASAVAVAALRVVSDQHFATDALTGAAIGALTGFGLPWLLHYRGGAPRDAASGAGDGASIGFVPAPLGGYVMGRF